jgi:hypothetical protein
MRIDSCAMDIPQSTPPASVGVCSHMTPHVSAGVATWLHA